MVKYTDEQKKQSKEFLLKVLKQAHYKVYTSVPKVSKSGMSRRIRLYVAVGGGITDITWDVSRVLDYKFNPDDAGILVQGCGMDMGFATVYNLSRTLYRGKKGQDSGYILKQYWL